MADTLLVHATVELVNYMRGPKDPWRYTEDIEPWCGATVYMTAQTVWGTSSGRDGPHKYEDRDGPVTCPVCLRAMWDAIPPVRRDWLLEQGLLTDYERMEPLMDEDLYQRLHLGVWPDKTP